MSRPEISFQRIELTYFIEDPAKDVLIKDIKPITSLKRESEEQNIKRAKLDKVKIDLKKKMKSPPEAGPPLAEKIEREQDLAKDKISEISKDSEGEKADTMKSPPKDGTAREDYCLKVREKIKSILGKNRKIFAREGDVYVRFVIDRNGVLNNLMLYKSSGKDARSLEAIAIESIKEASPFSPFSDEMDENELLFRLPIRFTYRP